MRIVALTLVGCSLVGMLLPQGCLAAVAQANQVAVRNATVDLTLSAQQTIQGQLVDSNGVPQAQNPIVLISEGQIVNKTVTAANGQFSIPVAKAGVYQISDGKAETTVRVWTASAAPPAARPGLLLVTGTSTERGALDNSTIGALIGVGVFAGVTAAVVAAAVDDDDDAS